MNRKRIELPSTVINVPKRNANSVRPIRTGDQPHPPKAVVNLNGYKVKFPFPDPYGPQKELMGSILNILDASKKTKTYGLLEAPTGIGKTMSVLSAVLEWYESNMSWIRQSGNDPAPSPPQINPPEPQPSPQPLSSPPGSQQRQFVIDSHVELSQSELLDIESLLMDVSEDDVPKPKKRKAEEPLPPLPRKRPHINLNMDEDIIIPGPKKEKEPEVVQPRKIIFSTRTHSQVEKAISELDASCYRPEMSVLGSREQYCIHPVVSKSPDRDQLCSAMIKKKKTWELNPNRRDNEEHCMFVDGKQQLAKHPKLSQTAWDIEDLVRLGKENDGCPFYAAKIRASEVASLIFCPYNYIIDPGIRKTLKVNLANSIIIIDEAHNVEDLCRESASFDINLNDVTDMRIILDGVQQCQLESRNPELLADFETFKANIKPTGVAMTAFEKFLLGKMNSPQMIQDQYVARKYLMLSGNDLKQLVEELTRSCTFSKAYAALEIAIESNEENDFSFMSPPHIFRAANFMRGLNYIQYDNYKYIEDFVGCFEQVQEEGGTIHRFSSMCLSSRLVFSMISTFSSAVILMSGTLSPFDALKGELGLQKANVVTLSTDHVIDASKQMCALRVTQHGKTSLLCDFKSQNTASVQDALGESVIKIMLNVPDGLLCFLPSYKLLDKLMQRWKVAKILDRMGDIKTVAVEPKKSSEFKRAITQYKTAIESKKGAVFFAVCRGKIAEGLDFADRYARAVIVIGIPFPYIFDTKIKEKKKYNDLHFLSDHLQQGQDWLAQQAFRSINQAVGRCIRHRNDYGAIILMDDRYKDDKNTAKLSSWYRTVLKDASSSDTGAIYLASFFSGFKNVQ